MASIFEITTLAGSLQQYEIIKATPMPFANNKLGVSIENIGPRPSQLVNELAHHAYQVYSLTGLDDAIRTYPALLTDNQLAVPERLRLIYDPLPFGSLTPMLRICPTEGEQIYLEDYDIKNALLPLEKISVSQEFQGTIDLRFIGLYVILHQRNFEAENADYYSRDLKQSFLTRKKSE